MARIVTCSMRIASICIPHNIKLAIAASIFVAAGVLLLYIVNLLFAQRLLRAQQPRVGWHPALSTAFKGLYVLIVFTLVMVITVTVQSFFTLSPNTHRIDRDIQLYAATCFAVVSFLPIPIVLLSLLLPREVPLQKFGIGRFRTKIAVLLSATTLISLGAAFRCGTTWKTPVPRTEPLPGYYSHACFYIFNFTVEVLVVYLYAILRIDRRFHVPDGSSKIRSYVAGGKGKDKGIEMQNRRPSVHTEEETFEDVDMERDATGDNKDVVKEDEAGGAKKSKKKKHPKEPFKAKAHRLWLWAGVWFCSGRRI